MVAVVDVMGVVVMVVDYAVVSAHLLLFCSRHTCRFLKLKNDSASVLHALKFDDKIECQHDSFCHRLLAAPFDYVDLFISTTL